MRYIGDIHASPDMYSTALKGCTESIQLGDYGHGFITLDAWPDIEGTGHRFIRGNHDDPALCRDDPQHIPSGPSDLYPNHFFIGGGYSIDWEYRLEDVSWWADEEHSPSELAVLVNAYGNAKPRIMVTHEAPYSVVRAMMPTKLMKRPSLTSRALESCLAVHKPKVWLFGHWHETKVITQGETIFMCLGEGEFIDL